MQVAGRPSADPRPPRANADRAAGTGGHAAADCGARARPPPTTAGAGAAGYAPTEPGSDAAAEAGAPAGSAGRP